MVKSIIGGDFEKADAVVIGVPYEQSASFGTGAENGPQKIKEMLDEQIELFDRYSLSEPAKDFSFGYKEIEVGQLSPKHMVHKVAEELLPENRFYILLGGVHSVSIPSLQSLAKKHDPIDVTVVQIDAHFDLREDDSDYNSLNHTPFAHSTVMRRAHELGYQLLPIGIRTMYSGEYEYANKHNIPYLEWGRCDTKAPSVEEVVQLITTQKVYLTIDVDGFDPSVMPGTGTPVPGGLSWEYGEHLIRTIMKNKEVVAADVVEVAPQESTGQTEYNAAQLVYHMLSVQMQKNLSA